ncbi:phosphoethanolamine transferase CptA [Orbaceae bacterium ESL0721]|nr:phosphoethanolamine transferase CptA [Orbaceae bacterium ESL0721]
MSNQIENRQFKWSSLIFTTLFFCYFSVALQLVIFCTGHTNVNGLRDAFIYSLIWLVPILFFPNYTRKIATVFGIIVGGLSLIPVLYFTIYGQEFSQSVFFIMAESNFAESKEYILQYMSLKIVIILIIYIAIGVFLWTRVKPIYLKNPIKYSISLLILLYALAPLGISYFIKQSDVNKTVRHLATRMETTVPWQLFHSYNEYRRQLLAMESILAKYDSLPPLANLKDSNGDSPRTLVLVIGESTTHNRMGLYDYPRDTTPEMERFRRENPNNLVIFNDVVSPRPYTIEVLQQALTFADEKHPDLNLEQPSLMHLMKQAGYKTFWITNQQTMTKRNTMLTMFSKQTDKQYYMNNDRNQSARQYDTNVFDPFKEVLADPAEKKFIVIHLLGTHMKYEFRYPTEEKYNRFNDASGIPAAVATNLDDNKLSTYNSYDNAVAFNDYVTTQLFTMFKNSHDNGFMLYFSDHGEDVYETPPHNILGRNEKAPTKTMYTVPFILWQSPEWLKAHPDNHALYQDKSYSERKYSTQDLIHTWSDLAGLSYDLYDPTKSIINQNYQERTRWIGDPYDKSGLIDYDKLKR